MSRGTALLHEVIRTPWNQFITVWWFFLRESRRYWACLWSSWQRTSRHGSTWEEKHLQWEQAQHYKPRISKGISDCESGWERKRSTDLKMGQCAELSQWKPLFFCPVRMSQMMMAWGSSLVSNRGLKVTTYLEGNTANNTDSFRCLPNTNYILYIYIYYNFSRKFHKKNPTNFPKWVTTSPART